MKKIADLVFTGFFVFFLLLFSLLPFFILFPITGALRWILLNGFGYRRKVMLKNLRDTFPDKPEQEIQALYRKAYFNLTEIIVEGIKAFTLSRRQVQKRHKVVNPEVAEQFLKRGQSVIVVTGHYANWEWGTLSAGVFIDRQVVAFYKPLSNPWIDRFIRRNRSRFGTALASIRETAITFDKYEPQTSVFLMAADQNPGKTEGCYWIKFLGRETVFLYGPEKYARLKNLPLVFADVQRVKRATYTVTLSVLAEDVRGMAEGVPTLLYARKLESVILQKPENWLWSHRRWKHKPDASSFRVAG